MKTTNEIQQFILNNHTVMSKQEMCDILDEPMSRVGANYASLSRHKLLTITEIKINTVKQVSKLDKLMSKTASKIATKKLTNTYSNDDGDLKEETRIKITSAIQKSNCLTSENPIISMPSYSAKMEMMFLNDISKKLNIIGCEYDKLTYQKLLMNVVKNDLNLSVNFGSMGDLLKTRKPNSISNLVLDYCGQFGIFYKDYQYAIENDLVEVNGIIALTVNNRISPNTEYIYDLMNELNPRLDGDEKNVTHTIRTFVNRIGGLKYKIEEVFPYSDKGKANMLCVIIRRIA